MASEDTNTEDGVRTEQADGAAPEVSGARKALVKLWTERVQKAKHHWGYAYQRMREDMRFARGKQWPGQRKDDERYVANLTQRHVNEKTGSLYAKNPEVSAKRRHTLDYKLWDGNPGTMMQALQLLQAMQQTPGLAQSPQVADAMALMQDLQSGQQRRKMLERLGETMALVFKYQLDEQEPGFKVQAKQLVRRVVTTGVGYVKLGYHRAYEPRPEDVDRVTDVTEQIAHLERLMEDAKEGEFQAYQAEAEELKQTLAGLRNSKTLLVKEGLDFDFPSSTSVIPDENCKQLKGFIGCRWVAQEFLLTPDQVQEIYRVDLKKNFTRYQARADGGVTDLGQSRDAEVKSSEKAAVYEVYDKSSGMVYTVCAGYPDFLVEPSRPLVTLERFWPIFTLAFNELEDSEDIFPPSDVRLMRSMQIEHNLSRQRLREHRDAARPGHVTSKGKLSDQDKAKLQGSAAHEVVELNGLAPGERIENVIQPKPINPIDPNLYEVNTAFADILKVEGSQQANFGGTSNATATESAIAQSSRMASIGSNVDDLDDFLSELARAGGDVLLSEMSAQTVQEIAGPGAVWPELSPQDVVKHIRLEIKAGSSGRPDKAQELQTWERLGPLLLQIPGIPPFWLANRLVKAADESIDLEDAYVEGLPSVIAQNAQAGPRNGTGGANAPENQGASGGQAGTPNRAGGQTGPNGHATGAPDSAGPAGAPNTVSRVSHS